MIQSHQIHDNLKISEFRTSVTNHLKMITLNVTKMTTQALAMKEMGKNLNKRLHFKTQITTLIQN